MMRASQKADREVDKMRAQAAKRAEKEAAKKKPVEEETDYEVDVEGLPKMYVKGDNPSQVKNNLRKVVKNPEMIRGVERVAKATLQKIFRDKASGKEEVELDEARKSDSYQFTHKPGDPESEKRLADLKKSVKGTGKRVVLQGRLGKDNPNAHKYSKDAPSAKYKDGKRVNSDVSGKSGGHSHQRIQKADAAHHDVYVYNRRESVEVDEAYVHTDFTDKTTPMGNRKAYAAAKANDEKKPVSLKKAPWDKKNEEVQLDEVSDKKLDVYRQKAFADQPSGDDGSDKYRKRKFGRDLAFAKQTGRAKVLATKESVEELDELSPNTLSSYASKANIDASKARSHMRVSAGGKDFATHKKRYDKRTAGAVRAGEKYRKLVAREEIELDEASDLRITKVYNKFPKKATYAVHSSDRKYYKEFDSMEKAKAHHAEKTGK
jgi:hypothetical protein